MPVSAELAIAVGDESGPVSGLLARPEHAQALYVLAHGAGAGMRHPFLERMAERLGERAIATLRYQFPYMERRARRPDSQSWRSGRCGRRSWRRRAPHRGWPSWRGGSRSGGA
jgi:predicted alpha/beta-hydrolase family hydrolase